MPAKKRVVIDKIGVEGFEKVPGKYVHVFLKLLYSSDIKTNLRIAVTRGIDTLLSTDLAMQELRGRSAAHTSAFVTSDVASLTISYFLMLAKYFQVPTVLQLGEQWITRNVGTSHHIEDLLDWLVFTQTLSLHEAQRHIIEIIARNIDRTEGTQLMQYPQWDQLSAPVLKKLLFASHGYHLSTMSRLKKKAGWTG